MHRRARQQSMDGCDPLVATSSILTMRPRSAWHVIESLKAVSQGMDTTTAPIIVRPQSFTCLCLCLQTFAVQTSMGPHTALRHPDLQLFWWMHMGGQEESPWTSLWPHLHEFLACAPKVLLSEDGVGDQTELIRILAQPENLKQLQAAMHRMGFANYINAAELDMAFPLGSTLQEQIEALLQQRPMLLARTSKGAMVLPRTPLQQQLEDVVQAGLAGLLAGPTGGSIMDDDDYKSGLSEASR